VSFTFCCALIFVDTYAHTLLLEVISIFQLVSELGILEKQILLLQDTLMQIGLEMLMIERAPQKDVSMWGTILQLG
jgi:hypothetical protein